MLCHRTVLHHRSHMLACCRFRHVRHDEAPCLHGVVIARLRRMWLWLRMSTRTGATRQASCIACHLCLNDYKDTYRQPRPLPSCGPPTEGADKNADRQHSQIKTTLAPQKFRVNVDLHHTAHIAAIPEKPYPTENTIWRRYLNPEAAIYGLSSGNSIMRGHAAFAGFSRMMKLRYRAVPRGCCRAVVLKLIS